MDPTQILTIIKTVQTVSNIAIELAETYQKIKNINPNNISIDENIELLKSIKILTELRIKLDESKKNI